MSVAYPDGAPQSACSDMAPQHGVTQSTTIKYDIASACYVIFPDDTMSVRVWDRFSQGLFRGVFMQVRNSNGDVSGTWNANPPNSANMLKTISCSGKAASAVTHKNRTDKTDLQTLVTWTAPSSCQPNEEFEIRGTVVKQYSSWTKVTVPLVCNPDYSNVAVMERVRPPLTSQYCAVGSWAIIPKEASTSFEGAKLPRGGWRHLYGGAGFRFLRKSGPTPSANTGPPSAQSGQYYFYYEASGRKNGDMAGLFSPLGIQGCFCFSFYCHMNTDGKTRFTLRTIGQVQREILSTTEVTNYWRRVAYTFVSRWSAVFLFQVFSSGADNGDIGLDNIKVEAGPCNATSTGYAGFIDLDATTTT